MNNWPITYREPKDEYGDPLPAVRDYLDTDVPEEHHTEAHALRYVDPWRMAVDDILDMPYAAFMKRTLLYKAITMRRPTKSQHDKYMRNTFGRR